MPPRTLKETYSRKKSSEFVESAVTIHGDEIGASLAAKLREHLAEGEEIPDVRLFFALIGRRLGEFRAAMVEAAQAHANELANDDALRKRRGETAAALSRDYVSLRTLFSETFGPEEALSLGFEANVARDPAALELQVERLIANLSDPELVLPPPRLDGVTLSLPRQVEVLRPNLDELKRVRAALDEERRKADRTLLRKLAAVTSYDREFLLLSRCLEAGFALAGEKGLAARVRPSLRRPGRRQAALDEEPEVGDPTPGGPEPGAEPPSDPSAGAGGALIPFVPGAGEAPALPA